jgi:hypothetical protein
MANPNHLEILNQGDAAWRKWRQGNPTLRPDLRGLDLVGINLFRADLSRCDLNEVNLKKANLREANLSGANLAQADLSEAVCTKAKMIKANLQQADLIGIKLGQADLRRANFHLADLFGADLSEADLRGAVLMAANLSSAIISGARLHASIRDDWKVNGIICDHIFWDPQGRQRIPAEGKFKHHQFESIYETLPTPYDHFAASVVPQATADILILKRNTHDGLLKITPTVFSESLLAYLNAVADLQHLIYEYSGVAGSEVAVISISQHQHITVEITGAAPLLTLIRETIVPWRRRYGREVEKIDRAINKACIIDREAEILEIRSNTEANTMEARMLQAEAAKMRAEAHLLVQKGQEISHFIYREMETDLLKLLPTENMPPNRVEEFKSRASTPMQLLAKSDLAD